jgi:aspartate carbamoyltransferase catalytic subunit
LGEQKKEEYPLEARAVFNEIRAAKHKGLTADLFKKTAKNAHDKKIEELGVSVSYDLDKIIGEQDVLNILRIQLERQRGAFFPSIREYAAEYGISRDRLKKAKSDVIIMHPGPVNRGVELAGEVADGPHSVILDQVTNGVAVRMAVLFLTTMVER